MIKITIINNRIITTDGHGNHSNKHNNNSPTSPMASKMMTPQWVHKIEDTKPPQCIITLQIISANQLNHDYKSTLK